MKKDKNLAILLLRVSIPFTMLVYGINKLIMGVASIEMLLEQYGLPRVFAQGVFVGEIVAPLMIMLGFRTRLAGLLFAFNSLVAILLAQTQNIFRLNDFGGWSLELLAIYVTSGMVFYYLGAGKYALSNTNSWD